MSDLMGMAQKLGWRSNKATIISGSTAGLGIQEAAGEGSESSESRDEKKQMPQDATSPELSVSTGSARKPSSIGGAAVDSRATEDSAETSELHQNDMQDAKAPPSPESDSQKTSTPQSGLMNSDLVRRMGARQHLTKNVAVSDSPFPHRANSQTFTPISRSASFASSADGSSSAAAAKLRYESRRSARDTLEDLVGWKDSQREGGDEEHERYFKLCFMGERDGRFKDGLDDAERSYFRGFLLDDSLLTKAAGAITLNNSADRNTMNRVGLLASLSPKFRAKVVVVANVMALDVVRAQQMIIAEKEQTVSGRKGLKFDENDKESGGTAR